MESTLIYIGITAALLLALVFIYNGIIKRFNAVERAWTDVVAQERQKNKIIPHLEALVGQYQLHESSLLTAITELRTALGNLSANNLDAEGLAAAEAKTAQLVKGINVAVENYPELKASDVFNNFMREIAAQQENIGAAIRIFNRNVEDFNNGIEVFPNAMVNAVFNRKEKIAVFTDQAASDGFDYTPKL